MTTSSYIAVMEMTKPRTCLYLTTLSVPARNLCRSKCIITRPENLSSESPAGETSNSSARWSAAPHTCSTMFESLLGMDVGLETLTMPSNTFERSAVTATCRSFNGYASEFLLLIPFDVITRASRRRKEILLAGKVAAPGIAPEAVENRQLISCLAQAPLVHSKHTDQKQCTIEDIKLSRTVPNKFRLTARIVDYHPFDIINFTIRICRNCSKPYVNSLAMKNAINVW